MKVKTMREKIKRVRGLRRGKKIRKQREGRAVPPTGEGRVGTPEKTGYTAVAVSPNPHSETRWPLVSKLIRPLTGPIFRPAGYLVTLLNGKASGGAGLSGLVADNSTMQQAVLSCMVPGADVYV